MRRATSRAFSRELKAEMRKKPSPWAPKPAPGVITTCASCSILSKNSQLPMPPGVCTHTYGAFFPPHTFRPALRQASLRMAALPR